jgi:hypothetical protein
MLAPQGPAVERISLLWWFMLVVGVVVWLGVKALLGTGLARNRHPAAQLPVGRPRSQGVATRHTR